MSRQCAVAVFDTFESAQEAIHLLDQHEYPADQVSLVANSVKQEVPSTIAMQYGDESRRDAAIGAGMGGLLGLLLGTPLLAIPGIGLMLIAGPLAAGLTGAIVGGFLGSLAGWGVHQDHVAEYEEAVRKGKFLVVAHGDPLQVDSAKYWLEKTDSRSVTLHAQTSGDQVSP